MGESEKEVLLTKEELEALMHNIFMITGLTWAIGDNLKIIEDDGIPASNVIECIHDYNIASLNILEAVSDRAKEEEKPKTDTD